MKLIAPEVYQISLGAVNAFLIAGKSLTLVDTGYKGSEQKIVQAIQKIDRSIDELEHIILTHHHPDHAGSAARLKELSGAMIYMHPLDAPLTEKGIGMRDHITSGPGLLNKFIFQFFIKPGPSNYPPCTVDHFLEDEALLSIGTGIKVIHVPGHSRGQIALLYQVDQPVLLAADVATNFAGIGTAPLYEDQSQGYQDIKKLSQLTFEVAGFGHGNPILKKAHLKFKKYASRLK